jgi:DnaK suppressor protein
MEDAMANNRYEKLRRTLEARRQGLVLDLDLRLRDVRSQGAYEGETTRALDTADSSNAELQQEIDITLVEMRSEALQRINEALQRLSDGVYGQRAECGYEISPARLEAVPFAVRCLDCELDHERNMGQRRRAFQEEFVLFKRLDSTSPQLIRTSLTPHRGLVGRRPH